MRAARAGAGGNPAETVQEAENIEGREVLTAYAPVAPLGWLMFVELPAGEAYAPLYAALQRLAFVLLAALAFAVLAGMFLARRMVGPIQALRTGAARLGSGDLSQRIAIKTGDELEALAHQFNAMAGQLQESYAGLEQKVEERTHELQTQSRACAIGGGATRPWRGDASGEFHARPGDRVVHHRRQAGAAGTEAGSIYVVDPSTHEFQLRATHGMSEELIAELNRQGSISAKGLSRTRQVKKQPVQVADLKDAPPSPVLNILLRAGYRALLIVPLLGPEGLWHAGDPATGARRVLPTYGRLCCRPSRHNPCWPSRTPICSRRWKRADQLELASKRRTRASMSHELRTPLNAIIGLTEMMVTNAARFGTEKAQAVKRVHRAGAHLLASSTRLTSRRSKPASLSLVRRR